ncbi:MAG: alpha-amylase family glycosyl hydrolase [Fidelibacterota bacterium]
MMKKLILMFGLFLAGCSENNENAIYFIPTQQLHPGEPLIMDMGLYKKVPTTKIHFSKQPFVDLIFDSRSDTLIISATDKTPNFSMIPFSANGQTQYLMVRLKQMVIHTFTYQTDEDDSLVVVMGSFNDWSRSQLKMEDIDGDGIFEKTVFLGPKKHEYKFVVNGEELIDPDNPVFVSNNIGGWNSILDLSGWKTQPPGKIFKEKEFDDRLTFVYEPPKGGAAMRDIIISMDNERLHPDVYDLDLNRIIVHKRGLRNGRLRIVAVDDKDRVLLENHTEIIDKKALNTANHHDSWYFSVLYSLMVDRFFDNETKNNISIDHVNLEPAFNFKGGDLSGVKEKLINGYFRDLNITALWISPLQQQPDSAFMEFTEPNRYVSGYHGYWPISRRSIDPRFGVDEDLLQIVNEAHEQDMKVILDFVSNHVHKEHPFVRENREWFGNVNLPDGGKNIRNWSEETRLTTWFDIFLPSFDYLSNPEAIEEVTNDAIWWLETYNLDGFRQDAVKHVPHTFWRELTSKIHQLENNKSYYQIGETFGSDQLIRSYVNPGELDAQFNFSIYFNARWQFSSQKADFSLLTDVIENNLIAFDPIHLMGNITSSHDQVRFIAFADGQMEFSDNGTERSFFNSPTEVKMKSSYRKLQNFHALNISLPGIPVIYYGEEIGMMGAGDPDNRRMMRFGDKLDLDEIMHKEIISNLNQLRRNYSALSLGDIQILLADGPIMVMLKKYFNEEIIVVINQGPQELNVELDPRYEYEFVYSTQPKSKVYMDSAILKPYSSLFARRIIK